MKKLFDKSEIWFAVLWIIVYVVGFGNADSLSEAMGVPKLLTVLFGLVLAAVLWGFVRKNSLKEYYGLRSVQGGGRRFLWFVPLVIISCVNLWNGLTMNLSVRDTLLYIVSMCLVGFLEEVIFRGLLFKAMSKSNLVSAVIVSSITFGAGHIVNLLLGAPLVDTLLQLVYASAIGFCYTAVFHAGGSIWPCIISHAFVNSTSVFAAERGSAGQIVVAAMQTAVSIAYGLWILRGTGLWKGKGAAETKKQD